MPDDFLATYAPLANDIATRTGLDPSVVLGIIDTETGGGQHVSGNNIFGISPSGPRGQYVAGYPDVQTAANAFITLMQTPRYRGVAAATDPASQVAALVKGGYNTVNPQYASIVTNKALNIGKQLGYQDKSGGGTEEGPAVYSTSAQPAATADQAAPDDSFVPAGGPAQPAQPPATTGSAKDRVLNDPALGGTSSAAPAAGSSAKDRVLADPALKTTETTTTTQGAPTQPGPGIPSPDEQSAETGLPLPSSPSPALNRITGAAAEGWSGVPAIPRVPSNLVMAPIYNPLIAGAETALRAGGGVLRGLQQTAVETLPNQLGRDVAALPEAFPFGFNALHPPGIPEAPPPGPRFVQELYGEGTPSNPLAAAPTAERPAFVPPGVNIPPRPVEPPAFIPPGEARPSPVAREAAPAEAGGPPAAAPVTEHTPWVSSTTADIQRVLKENAEAGGPTSLGAMATPEQQAKMTPAQVKANRRVAELNQIVTPIEGEDATEWVRGSTPTEAERAGTPTTSQKEVMTRQRNPDAFEGPNGQLTINDKARVNAFDETLLSDTQAADLKERQQKAASEAQTRILSTAKPVDLKAAADWIEAKLADPLIQEDKHVYNSLKGLRDQLYDADGNLKTDPRAAWGMHNNLRNKLLDAKDPFSANPSEKYAVTQTNEFKGLVDGALDKASDGQFRTHLDQQAEYLKSLNAWRLLNDFRYGPNKMINAKSGMINGNAFHRFVTDLAIRRGRPGIDAAMDVPDNVMQRLINIDQDLKRAGRIDLGKPRGSPTNLFFELAGALGITGAHALTAAMTAGTAFGGIANIGVQTGISAIQRRVGQRRINRLTEQALQPPPGGLTPPPGNPLQQPP